MSSNNRNRLSVAKWTYKGDYVLIVKCVARGGASYGGFQWPRFGVTQCPKAAANREQAVAVTGLHDDDCATGGLFGWAWGIIGTGKDPDYQGDWIVFASRPLDVVDLGDGKVKAVGPVEIVYYGSALGALTMTHEGRCAYIEAAAAAGGGQGNAVAEGGQENASASGIRSIAAAEGSQAAAVSSGIRGIAAASGDQAAAVSSEDRSIAAASGDQAAAASSGERGIAALSGEDGTIEVEAHSLGAVTAQTWYWRVREGSAVACQWKTKTEQGETWERRLLISDELGLKEGALVKVVRGEIKWEVSDLWNG